MRKYLEKDCPRTKDKIGIFFWSYGGKQAKEKASHGGACLDCKMMPTPLERKTVPSLLH